MIQVKEFVNFEDNEMNSWLADLDSKIRIIDIKYSPFEFGDKMYSNALVIYETSI